MLTPSSRVKLGSNAIGQGPGGQQPQVPNTGYGGAPNTRPSQLGRAGDGGFRNPSNWQGRGGFNQLQRPGQRNQQGITHPNTEGRDSLVLGNSYPERQQQQQQQQGPPNQALSATRSGVNQASQLGQNSPNRLGQTGIGNQEGNLFPNNGRQQQQQQQGPPYQALPATRSGEVSRAPQLDPNGVQLDQRDPGAQVNPIDKGQREPGIIDKGQKDPGAQINPIDNGQRDTGIIDKGQRVPGEPVSQTDKGRKKPDGPVNQTDKRQRDPDELVSQTDERQRDPDAPLNKGKSSLRDPPLIDDEENDAKSSKNAEGHVDETVGDKKDKPEDVAHKDEDDAGEAPPLNPDHEELHDPAENIKKDKQQLKDDQQDTQDTQDDEDTSKLQNPSKEHKLKILNLKKQGQGNKDNTLGQSKQERPANAVPPRKSNVKNDESKLCTCTCVCYYQYCTACCLFVCLVAVVIEAEEYTGYGTWHFFTLFILTAAVAIICYFGLLNRKRVCG